VKGSLRIGKGRTKRKWPISPPGLKIGLSTSQDTSTTGIFTTSLNLLTWYLRRRSD